jgi:hypothetical protein
VRERGGADPCAAGDRRALAETDELRCALFFAARSEHHTGAQPYGERLVQLVEIADEVERRGG